MSAREGQAAKGGPDRRRGGLWIFALAFFFLAAGWARTWAGRVSEEWNWPGFDSEGLAEKIGKGAAPLLVAIALIVFLWKTVGLPYSPSCGTSAEPWTGTQGAPQPADYARNFWRSVLWVGMLGLLLASCGWALLSVVCASDGGSDYSVFEGQSASAILAEGFSPLAVVFVLTLLLWVVMGPPFVRPRK